MRIITANIQGIASVDLLQGLVSAIQQLKPDVVLFQEVRGSIKNTPDILLQMKTKSNLNYMGFTPCFDLACDYGKGILQKEHILEGLGILSSKPFTAVTVFLPIINGLDRWPRTAVIYTIGSRTICHLHLSKHAPSRKASMKNIPDADIYAGDFNMTPDEVREYFPFPNSFDHKNYISFPSKKLTLDYVIVKKGKIKDVRIIESVSDHAAIFTRIT